MAHCTGYGTVEVQAGDSLWRISEYVLKYEGNSNPTPQEIQNLSNQIYAANKDVIGDNPNLIYPGQVFRVRESTATTTESAAMKTAEVLHLGLQTGTDRTVYATWQWDQHDKTEKYEYEWYYDTGDSPTLDWFFGGNADSGKQKHVAFSVPENAKRILFKVKPIGMTQEEAKKNGS